jgi:hypothetical protein
MAYSSDLSSWTVYGNVIPNATLPTEDPWVWIGSDGTYHMWCENNTTVSEPLIAYFTSSDGISWSLQDSNVIALGSGGSWDDYFVASPIVWEEGGTWYMLYEGDASAGSTSGQVGLATASDPAGPWSKDAGNPVFAVGTGGSWYDEAVVSDGFLKIGSNYYMSFHGYDGSIWRGGIVTATDPAGPWSLIYDDLPLAWIQPAFHRLGGSEFGKGVAIYNNDAVHTLQFIGDPATQTEEWPDTVSEESAVPRSGVAIANGIMMV